MQNHVIIALTIWSATLVDTRKIIGISMSYKRFYRERKSFLCIDGSKLIPFDRVNDDYCDCADGSDEPGTAACGNGRFYCVNLGFRPHYIPSSRVNDGICDCCDGSDEYSSHMQCESTCRNLGQKERDEMVEKMKALNEGLRLKRQLIDEGSHVWQEKQAQLRDLQKVSEELQVKIEAQKKTNLAAEAKREGHRGQNQSPDDVLKDSRLKAGDEQQRGQSQQHAELRGGGGASEVRADGAVGIGAMVAGVEAASADLKKLEEAYETAQMEIRDLKEKLAIDYGPEREFLYLLRRCVQLGVYEYLYTLCPFHQITQKTKAGSEVLLGKWSGWAGPGDSSHRQMKYEEGEPCWQGPARSTQVTLMCGTDTVLRSVKEPSKCHYAMEFLTPAACYTSAPKPGIHSEL